MMHAFTRVRRLLSIPFVLGIFLGVAITGLAAGSSGSSVFSDVQPGSYYDEAVGEMYDLGIIKGYDNGRFGPNDFVTRGQIAVMMKRLRDEITGGGTVSREEEEEVVEEEEESSSSSSRSSTSSSSAFSQASIGPAGGVHFTIKTFTVNETAGVATISVVRTGGNQGAVSVDYAMSDGSAKGGTDYTAVNGTLAFANKETSKIFTIPIANDSEKDGNKTVNLTLSNPTNGAVLTVPPAAVLTIVDDESITASASSAGVVAPVATTGHRVGFTAAAYGVSENDGTITITVKREGGTGPVSVSYSATPGTAGGGDYSVANGTLSFGDAETVKTFTVTVTDDTVPDGNKTVSLALTSPTGGVQLGDPATVTLTIIDNEATPAGTGSLKFSATSTTIGENAFAKVTISRVGGSRGAISISYATNDGSAKSGEDYTSTTGTVTFQAGETAKTILVPVLADTNLGEAEEYFTVNLNSPTGGASIITPSSITVKISG